MTSWSLAQVVILYAILLIAAAVAYWYTENRRMSPISLFKITNYGGAVLILLYGLFTIYAASKEGVAVVGVLPGIALIISQFLILPLLLVSCFVIRAIAWEVPRDMYTMRQVFLYRYGGVYVILLALLYVGMMIATQVNVQEFFRL